MATIDFFTSSIPKHFLMTYVLLIKNVNHCCLFSSKNHVRVIVLRGAMVCNIRSQNYLLLSLLLVCCFWRFIIFIMSTCLEDWRCDIYNNFLDNDFSTKSMKEKIDMKMQD